MNKLKKVRIMVFLARAGSILALVGIPVAMAMLWGVLGRHCRFAASSPYPGSDILLGHGL